MFDPNLRILLLLYESDLLHCKSHNNYMAHFCCQSLDKWRLKLWFCTREKRAVSRTAVQLKQSLQFWDRGECSRQAMTNWVPCTTERFDSFRLIIQESGILIHTMPTKQLLQRSPSANLFARNHQHVLQAQDRESPRGILVTRFLSKKIMVKWSDQTVWIRG